MLAEYVPDQYFVLEKNESYWNKDAVSLDRITYRFFDDTQAMQRPMRPAKWMWQYLFLQR